MQSSSFIYPPSPAALDETKIQPSPEFKKNVMRTMGAILFFAFVYLLLLAGAFVLAAAAVLAGGALIMAVANFFTLMIGLGLIGMALLVIFFLFKFIFKRNKVDRSGLIKLNEKDQPELFEFVRRLTAETHTPFPKGIYLSTEVNACVFYDSSFWSMVLPVKKNLQIGLGLVNSVNISEFKAILGHEFGHFSQRSMKLGSYTYNVNQVIHNMLYDNEGYGRALQGFASASGYFAFFANITVGIVEGIQRLLREVYAVVNKSYMGLSRQMEFHADAVAASVSGSTPLITSLRRIDAADLCYQNLFSRYDAWVKDSRKAVNLYTDHTELMRLFAADHEIPFEHGLLQVNASSFSKFYKSRIQLKNQWASHPDVEDREAHLKSLDIDCGIMNEPAWIIFRDAEALQKQVTEMIYKEVKFPKDPQPLDTHTFVEKFKSEMREVTFNKKFKGYYDLRNVSEFDVEQFTAAQPGDAGDFDTLFSDANAGKPAYITGLQGDINLLEEISKNEKYIKTFDLDGIKYKSAEAKQLKEKLEAELKSRKEELEEQDKRVFRFFYNKASLAKCTHELMAGYRRMFSADKVNAGDMKLYNDIVVNAQQFYVQNTYDAIEGSVHAVHHHEDTLKPRIRQMLADEGYAAFFSEDDRSKLEKYVSKRWEYFISHKYDEQALETMKDALDIFLRVVNERAFKTQKELLEWKLGLVGEG